MSDYSLLLPFDTDAPEFTRGVEVGMLYETVRRCPGAFERMIHAENAEMALRIGEATGRHVSASDVPETDEWLTLNMGPSTSWPAPASNSPVDGNGRTAGTLSLLQEGSASHGSRSCRSLTACTALLCAALAASLGWVRRAYLRLRGRWGFLDRSAS